MPHLKVRTNGSAAGCYSETAALTEAACHSYSIGQTEDANELLSVIALQGAARESLQRATGEYAQRE